MDKIFIRDLKLSVIVGTLPHERLNKQEIILNVELGCDAHEAGKHDDLNYAVDYSKVEASIIEAAENSSFQLLEALSEYLADICLSFNGVRYVKILTEKPGAPVRAKSIALEIERTK